MSDDLVQRGELMESLFYKRQDQELLQKIRDEQANQELRAQLTVASGLDNVEVIDALIKVGITTDSMTAVALIPLVSVAWADREMQNNEKDSILQAAHAAGIVKDSSGFSLLSSWLEHRPDSDLLDAWKAYIGAVKATTDATTLNRLKSSVLGKAKQVAESAGGILGLGNKVSEVEQQTLDDLESAF